MLFKSIFFAVTLMAATSVCALTPPPTLDHFAVSANDIFQSAPASVDLTSYEGASKFKTKLEQGAKKGPNFAGHYTLVSFGCGTQCQDNWLIDAKTGKIWDRFPSVIGITHEKNSYLLIVNPSDTKLLEDYKNHPEAPFWSQIQTTYELWKDNKFEVLQQMPWIDFSTSSPSSGAVK